MDGMDRTNGTTSRNDNRRSGFYKCYTKFNKLESIVLHYEFWVQCSHSSVLYFHNGRWKLLDLAKCDIVSVFCDVDESLEPYQSTCHPFFQLNNDCNFGRKFKYIFTLLSFGHHDHNYRTCVRKRNHHIWQT